MLCDTGLWLGLGWLSLCVTAVFIFSWLTLRSPER